MSLSSGSSVPLNVGNCLPIDIVLHPRRTEFSRKLTFKLHFFAAFHFMHSCSQSLLLFQLNAHNVVNTYIYHQLPPSCFGVYYTIFRETIALLARKLCFLQCCCIGCAIKCKISCCTIWLH